MKGDPHDYMQVGLAHFIAYPRGTLGRAAFVESIGALCRDEYFQVIEVTEIRREALRAEVQELVRASGKAIVFAAQPIQLRARLDLSAQDPRQRTGALDLLKSALEEAAEWRALAFTVVSGPDPGDEGREDARERLIGSLKELCEVSRSRSAPPVLLSVRDRLAAGLNRLVGPSEEAQEVVKAVIGYYPRFGLSLDFSDLPLLDEAADLVLSRLGEHLRHVHIGNCLLPQSPSQTAPEVDHPPFAVDGGEHGPAELAAFLRHLLEAGYLNEEARNPVTIAVRPLKGQTAHEAIESSKGVLDEAWKRV